MLILPAIDLRGGKCVRLKQGDYARETVFGDDPVGMARRWVSEGAKALHLVDLDGAKAGNPVNGDVIRRIVEAVDVPCQVGGGLRTEADIETTLAAGVARVVLGTRALQDPAWVRDIAQAYPKRIVLGLDARDGKVATHGWLETSEASALDMAREFARWPLYAIVYTDIARDGMLGGPDLEGLAALAAAVPVPVIASGGVTTLQNVRDLAAKRLFGCIIGRALYEGQIDLSAVLELVDSPTGTTTSKE
ncbi:MAG TPA: 1-(5-phosphoribosyl)-5-[(5-phosphoribosylamino)methylideneamino]imidazole-4-carboxamide isomerase [Gemmataceae bacterium]|jgi:phosphoribosylformimino-5-aminoimidazole carboxamide ribotide isomerase|nr:1-(5-phosphoribosyl)-5-[(5-phosphoribosylamino)methylideneamino]imidazole-4-carboxamide isomerase [Gemmataceae bacterium]